MTAYHTHSCIQQFILNFNDYIKSCLFAPGYVRTNMNFVHPNMPRALATEMLLATSYQHEVLFDLASLEDRPVPETFVGELVCDRHLNLGTFARLDDALQHARAFAARIPALEL